MLGDIFDSPNQPVQYLYKVIDAFLRFKEDGIKVYSIVGNHDIPNNLLENLDRSALGLLFKVGAVKELRTEQFMTKEGYDIALHGFHYPEAIEPLMSREIQAKVNICAMHRYFEYSLAKNSLNRNQLSGMGYQIYTTGHLHPPFEPEKIEDFTMIRPGRLMRGTSNNYNTEDANVFMDTIQFNGSIDTPRLTMVRDIIPTKLASEVFSIMALNKDRESGKFINGLSSKVTELLNLMEVDSTGGSNIYRVLDKLNIDIRIKDRVTFYLEKDGIFRSQDAI